MKDNILIRIIITIFLISVIFGIGGEIVTKIKTNATYQEPPNVPPIQTGSLVYIDILQITGKVDSIYLEIDRHKQTRTWQATIMYKNEAGEIDKTTMNTDCMELIEDEE